MADKKISALTAAATPLAGTEVLPIVQSGSTVKVSVADLTAGRAVSSSNLTYTGTLTGSTGVLNIGSGQVYKDASGNVAIGSTSPAFAAGSGIMVERAVAPCISFKETGGTAFDIFNIFGSGIISNRSNNPINVEINGAAHSTFVANGSFSIANGNLVIGTAGKGIDFSAATHAAGMTSELLNDYEEGTWTPVLSFGGGSTGITYAVQEGHYTRVGRYVTGRFIVLLSSKGSSTGDALIAGLPFTVASYNGGAFTTVCSNFASNAPTQGYCNQNSNQIVPWIISGTGVTGLTDANFNNNTRLDMWFQYFV
jgi:hypothetical protein